MNHFYVTKFHKYQHLHILIFTVQREGQGIWSAVRLFLPGSVS